MDDYAIPAPQVPDPAAPDAVVDASAVEDQCAPDLDLLDVGEPHGPAEQRNWAEANCQSVALVHDGQVVECWGEQGDEQADAASDVDAWSFTDHPAEGKAEQSGAVQDQTQRGLLRVGVASGRRVCRHRFFDFVRCSSLLATNSESSASWMKNSP